MAVVFRFAKELLMAWLRQPHTEHGTDVAARLSIPSRSESRHPAAVRGRRLSLLGCEFIGSALAFRTPALKRWHEIRKYFKDRPGESAASNSG